MEGIDEIIQLLSSSKNILITSHRNPDGDAIGSSLALYHWLKTRGHLVTIALPSEYPDSYHWMNGIENIQIYDLDQTEIEKRLDKLDIVFALDYNSLERIDTLGELLLKKKPVFILIDHHLYPEPFADYMLSDSTASSTCELIYRFIHLVEPHPYISLEIAESIYTGIVTDTGSFQYGTSPAVFRLAATLQEHGLNVSRLNQLIFNSLHEKTLRLLGHCLANRMEILDEFRSGLIYLNKQDFKVFDIRRGDTEGIINYLLKLKDVNFAAFIRQQPTIVKLSFRSKGNFSVEDLARRHFNGGGHKNAAGGYYKNSLSATIEKFKSVLPHYKDEIIKSMDP